jgi:hypothetical protein
VPVSTPAAYAAGFTRPELRSALRRGLLVSPRRGLLAISPAQDAGTDGGAPDVHDAADAHPTADDVELARVAHVRAVRAALAAVSPGAFATHDSAALVQRLARPSTRIHARVSLASPGVADFTGPGLVVRGSEVPAHVVAVVDGIPVTDLRRTAVDLARGRSLAQALIPLDAAARRLAARQGADAPTNRIRAMSPSGSWSASDVRAAVALPGARDRARREFEYALTAMHGWRGVVSARRAVTYADPRSESPLESRSRGWFITAGISALDIGVRVDARGSTYWADFCSREHRVIGEADGWAKYGATTEAVRFSLKAERRRQEDLEGEGWRFVRWTSDDQEHEVVARMRQALR